LKKFIDDSDSFCCLSSGHYQSCFTITLNNSIWINFKNDIWIFSFEFCKY
jgi:hypothetical protein